MKHYDETHILALDIRHSRIGYALFSGPKRLLDWGASAVPVQCSNRKKWAQQKMIALLRHCSPEFIVAKHQRGARLSKNAKGKPILKEILSVAKERGVPIHFLGCDEIHSAFRIFQAHTKEDIACILMEKFPELLIRLPPKRKKWWDSEPRRMIIFDAVATGFAYWQRPPPRA